MVTKTGGRDFRREGELRQAQIDTLIDAYERDGTRSGSPQILVDAFPGELKFATLVDGRLHYRGRILVPIKKRTPSKQTHDAASQADIESVTTARHDR